MIPPPKRPSVFTGRRGKRVVFFIVLTIGALLLWRLLDRISGLHPLEAIPESGRVAIRLDSGFAQLDGSDAWYLGLQRDRMALERHFSGDWATAACWLAPEPSGEGAYAALVIWRRAARRPGWSALTDSAEASYEYAGQRLYQLGSTLWITRYRNLVLAGRFPFLLEDALEQLRYKSLHPDWRALRRQGGRSLSGIWLRPGGLQWLAGETPFSGEAGAGLLLQWDGRRDPTLAGYASSDGGQLPEVGGGAYLQLLSFCPDDLGWARLEPLAEPEHSRPEWWQQTGPLLLTARANFLGTTPDAGLVRALSLRETAPDLIRTLLAERTLLDSRNRGMFTLAKLSGPHPLSGLVAADSLPAAPWLVQLESALLCSSDPLVLEWWLDKLVAGAVVSGSEAWTPLLPSPDEDYAGLVLWQPGAGGPAAWASLGRAALGYDRNGSWRGGRDPDLSRGAAFRTGWRSRLGDRIRWGPHLLRPAGNARPLILAQDEANRLYALSPQAGKLLWTYDAGAPLLGEPALIEGNNPGRYTLALLSAGSLHRIDADGSPVPPFPIELPARALGGLTRFPAGPPTGDWLLFPAENGGIYGYSEAGTPLPNWSPVWGVGRAAYALQPARYGQEDYFFLLNREGRVFTFDRRGSLHFPPRSLSGTVLSPPGLQVRTGQLRWIGMNSNGRALVLNETGENFGLRLDAGKAVRFCFADVTGDDRKDYFTLSGRRLRLQYYEGNDFRMAWERPVPIEGDRLFELRPPMGKSWLGVLDTDARKFWVVDGRGDPLFPSPIASDRPPLLLEETAERLLLAGCLGDELFVFELNRGPTQ